ncbi:MAG TPA: CDP-diacylglycerol--serine O-phosphatidyltransferase [Blastocatellia bacterium]|nr:CDP-diacylglycerol--serine O-phosphatidyltransferase [Blastocatellia bacterium]
MARPPDGVRRDAQDQKARRPSRKAVYVIPSMLTTANIFCGFYSVMESLAGARVLAVAFDPHGTLVPMVDSALPVAVEHFDRAAITIGFAALFDLLDGRVARMTNTTSEFGLELDSIADVVSFGIAPAVLAFAWGYGQLPDLHNVGWAASFLFLICGALRLARFNVQARRPSPHPPKNPKADKKAFVGMPIPIAATMVAAIVHFWPTPLRFTGEVHLWSLRIGSQTFLGTALVVLVACLALLMVSTIRYSSFKNVGVGNRNPRIIVLGFALAGVTVWFYSRYALLILATVYASHGVVAKLWSLVKPRRASADHSELELDGKPQGSKLAADEHR